jgi:hypothetical protein
VRWDSFTLVTPNWMTRLPGHVLATGTGADFIEVEGELEDHWSGHRGDGGAERRGRAAWFGGDGNEEEGHACRGERDRKDVVGGPASGSRCACVP